MQRRMVEPRRHRPEESVAMVEIIEPFAVPEQIGARCDLAVVVGGDGTMLGFAREVAPFDLPLVGINQGRLGFITDVTIGQFRDALAPMIAGASLAVLDRISKSTELRDRLHENTAYFRKEIERIGFTIKPGTHPVVPVMLFEAPIAQKFAARMFELGVLLSGFFYPVVPMGQARVRVQLSAVHTREQLDTVLKAFEQAGKELGILKNN